MDVRMEKMGVDPEKLREFLSRHYVEQSQSSPEAETAGSEPGAGTPSPQERLQFHLKPEELIAYLDEYVIRQDEAKAILATKICTHFNRLNLPHDEPEEDLVGNIKNNILMVGPTGVGKTFLIKLIAHRLGVPFIKADATKFSETGYVGGDVEDLVRGLVAEAQGDIELAQHGIIYIDEIDKIAASRNGAGPDVSRSGVQRNLLKLMEETEVDLRSPHDLSSQMETVIQIQKTGKVERQKINTRNILFVVSGAFSGLEDIIGRRMNEGTMGFRLTSASMPAKSPTPTPSPSSAAEGESEGLLRQVRAEDLIEYGFESEFIGRLPVVAVLDGLDCDDLLQILRNPKCSVILSKKRDFLAYDIAIEFTDESLQMLAENAHEEHTGARGLVSAIERVLLNFEMKLPSLEVEAFTLTADVVRDPAGELRRFLVDQSIESFQRRFEADHGIRIELEEPALTLAKEMATERNQLPGELCQRLFADYGHGLRLLELSAFTISPTALRNPQAILDELIKERYSGES